MLYNYMKFREFFHQFGEADWKAQTNAHQPYTSPQFPWSPPVPDMTAPTQWGRQQWADPETWKSLQVQAALRPRNRLASAQISILQRAIGMCQSILALDNMGFKYTWTQPKNDKQNPRPLFPGIEEYPIIQGNTASGGYIYGVYLQHIVDYFKRSEWGDAFSPVGFEYLKQNNCVIAPSRVQQKIVAIIGQPYEFCDFNMTAILTKMNELYSTDQQNRVGSAIAQNVLQQISSPGKAQVSLGRSLGYEM